MSVSGGLWQKNPCFWHFLHTHMENAEKRAKNARSNFAQPTFCEVQGEFSEMRGLFMGSFQIFRPAFPETAPLFFSVGSFRELFSFFHRSFLPLPTIFPNSFQPLSAPLSERIKTLIYQRFQGMSVNNTTVYPTAYRTVKQTAKTLGKSRDRRGIQSEK